MRIAILAPHFAEYSIRYAATLSEYANVLLVIDRTSMERECLEAWGNAAVRRGCTIFSFRARRRWEKYSAVFAIILRTLVFRPNIVHAHEYGEPFHSAALAVLRFICPVVLTVHDPAPHSGDDAAYAQKRAHYLQFGRAVASAFVVHGAYCSQLLSKNVELRGRPVLQVAHGPCLVPEESQKRVPVAGRILFFGRMETYKGLDIFLAALAILRAADATFNVRLCGRGPELTRLKSQFLDFPNVEILDAYLTPEQAIEEFQGAAVVVAPYRDSTQSGVVACAFANGRSVVATRSGGLVDMIQDGVNGLLVPPSDPKALAEALQSLLAKPFELATLNKGADMSSSTSMSWNIVACKTMMLYGLLGDGTARSKNYST